MAVFPLLSCSQGTIDPVDLSTGTSRKEYRKLLTRDRLKEKQKKASFKKQISKHPIPKISKLIIAPPPPAIGGEKRISFSVTDQAPLKDVLVELGRVANIDIDVDPSISGGVIINAKNKPLKEIIDRIATQGGLRYSFKNGVLYFQSGKSYPKNYHVDYLKDGSVWTDVETNISSLLAITQPNGAEGDSTPTASFTSNKSAGIITLYASEKQHRLIEDYLQEVEKYASAQVIIEAKIVEVTLKDEFKTGIAWGRGETDFTGGGFDGSQPITFITNSLFGKKNLNLSISALEQFGTTKTLSSPRLHAINNQKAKLNFSDKLVYFQIENNQQVTVTTGSTPANTQTLTSSKQEENVGVELEITPAINLDTREIIMNIKPKVSVKSDDVIDPASPSGIDNNVPVIQTREIDTIAKIKSGNIFVIGGLMKETASNSEQGVPFLQRIPILGWLFKSINKDSTITETVIFIKATIVNSSSSASGIDRKLQDSLDPNKRRFF